ncbi:MAG TPA: hypothetical protein DDX40_03155 [Rikenellaceae bacterium]|nr:hypothetical protein [Rikenellaceae bacterium]
MRNFIKSVLCSVLLGFSIMMPAQNLPALQKDGAVTTGNLTNGITYYLVTNPSMKGVADFALVRKGACDTLSARKELSSLPHFNKTIPYKFLSRKGIGCRSEGYISYRDDATIFRFDDVPVFDQAASDTTLLMLFDLIAAQPRQHAIIIAGDINTAAIKERMNVFSLMVPSRNPSYKKKEYVWRPSSGAEYSFIPSVRSSVTVEFRSPRTPDDQMNTIQPFISELFSGSLREIVASRLRESFISRDIPVKSSVVEYVGSADCAGDERFAVSVMTARDQLMPASMAVASVLSEICSKGVGADEYLVARNAVLNGFLGSQTNEALVLRCVSSYLYGADLASPATKANFFSSRNMSTKAETELFNGYAVAMLSEMENPKVTWTGNEEDYDEWLWPSLFGSVTECVSMLEKPLYRWPVVAKDTSDFWNEKNKVKVRSVTAEPVSDGEMWTFSNGMKVIYKKMPTKGRFSYSMMIKGGFSIVRNLPRGEGAFFSDMFGLCDIAGMSGSDFDKVLRTNGVDMSCAVSASDLRLYGSAPSNRFTLTLKALLSAANQRKPSTSAFRSWRRMELTTLKPAYLDSLMYQDYNYSSVKTPSGLTARTMEDASDFFDNQFVRVNDGVLVLVGDLSAESVQKILCQYLGGFRVSKSSSVRQFNPYKMRTGATTYSRVGTPVEISLALACAEPFTTENYMAFKVAGLALQRRLTGVMAEHGFSVRMADRFSVWPQEALELIFTCSPVPESGLPYGVDSGSDQPMKSLVAARKVIEDVLSKPVNAAELASCKSLLTNSYSTYLADPKNYVDAILMRYSGGKDVLTGYNNRIGSVSADKVKEIFGALSEGMRIEYVVKQ